MDETVECDPAEVRDWLAADCRPGRRRALLWLYISREKLSPFPHFLRLQKQSDDSAWERQFPMPLIVIDRGPLRLADAREARVRRLMREKLDTGDAQARKALLRSAASKVEVGDDEIRIVGDKATPTAVIAGR